MEHHSKPSTRMKRKPSTTTVFPNSKRRRHHPLPAPVSLGLASSVSTRSKFKPQHSNLHRASKLKPEKEEQLTLFSRYADPSVNSPKPYKYKSTKVNQVDRRQPNEAVAVKEVVDLASVSDMTNLDMVEGDEILATMLRASTPRSKRRFPTEKTLTDSEQRDQEAIRRRRLKIRSEYSAMKDQQKLRDENIGFTALLHDIEAERNLKEHSAIKKGAGEVRVDERAQLELEQAETDEETTESKINRLSKALHMNWRHFMQWLLSGVVLLCVVVMAAPFVRKILETPLPYCDSEWIEAIDESFVLTDPADDFDRSKALQPFIGANTNTNLASRPACQPCPVFGNCLNGSVISCAPPFTLRAELCTEDQEAQENLNRVARNIYKFVAEKAAKNAFVTETISFGKAVSILPREYVFNRALDMALRNLGDTCVTEDQSQLIVSENVVPWSCRAKRQLYSHIKLIMLAITLGTMLVFSYRKFLFYRAERQLVDRFVKEVRFCLLDRTRRPDRYYPSDHLRDDLFEKQSVQDRAWLIKSVWPKVVAIVNDDSRIKTRLMKVRGDDQIVWEWAFSSSPARQPTRGEAYRVSLRPQSASRNRFRSTQVNQRKKLSL
ncbi:hypothetical protein F444_12686 [Plasmopara halstedii]|uniref:Man1/Src1-like C-terminal domain-containing protein n=1 Tax=Plasmopara halstedii TaxID=4781 RepID=A0A0P1AQ82_PLAHL|nr:hypothetical protein F444_12686 [Plasmopara halstedii]CEG43333.1 hypothetical protein F444_12686 [Plasmopara halstedii]|eukprot:XP_024579702.1 hypothetical protein F444_12686 [Plasmopara halstedii]